MCVSYYVVYQCGCIGPSRLEECSAYWEDECEGVVATPQLAPHKCNACRKKPDRRADPGFGILIAHQLRYVQLGCMGDIVTAGLVVC
jgi:hypothetical protein